MRKLTHNNHSRAVRRLLPGAPFRGKSKKPRRYGDPNRSPRLESASEKKRRKRVEARHRAGHFPKLVEAESPDDK